MIDVSPDIDAYFEEIVLDAVMARRVEVTEAARHYVAGLLCDYARGEQLDGALDQPLTFQLHDALQARGADRFERLRSIGDGVLYILGFFGSNLTRRGADRDYVMSVGSSAYGHASSMLRMGGGGALGHDVLGELSDKYAGFVDVVSEVADGALVCARDDASVLRLYERWQDTGSARLAGALGALGLCPLHTDKGLVH